MQALDLGADDFICKPFGINEVLARIRVALRHAAYVPLGTDPCMTIGPLQMDLEKRYVSINEREVKLTPAEYDLLKVLIKNRGKIMTPQMLLTQVWGVDHDKKRGMIFNAEVKHAHNMWMFQTRNRTCLVAELLHIATG